MLEEALSALDASTEFGSAAVLLSMPGPDLARPFAKGIQAGAARFGRPVVAAVAAGPRYTADFRDLMGSGPVPVFASPRRAAAALHALLKTDERLLQGDVNWQPEAPVHGSVPGYLAANGPAGEVAAKRFFADRGLPIPCGRVATSEEEAASAVRELEFPLAAKTTAVHAIHKMAGGLVRIGIRDEVEALRAFGRIRANARAAGLVEGADGVLFEEERSGGAEVFMGALRDPTFGLLVGVGVGGTRVEALSAVRWELAPLDSDRVGSLVDAAAAWGLLHGSDGSPLDAAALGQAIVDFYEALRGLGDRLVEAEINPLAVFAEGDGVCVLDAVLELARGPGAEE
jgi:acyl-CoA synthetase (NDP forming)